LLIVEISFPCGLICVFLWPTGAAIGADTRAGSFVTTERKGDATMDRRSMLRAVGTSGAVLAAGCLGGTVRHDVQRSVRIPRGEYWVSELPPVEGSGAISYTVRAERRFDVYVFTDDAAFETYRDVHGGGSVPSSAPRGDRDLGMTAVEASGGDQYVARTADEGAREPYGADSGAAFVVDHSAYAIGAAPAETADPLSPFVDLEVVETTL
jgi:hypothetical protein